MKTWLTYLAAAFMGLAFELVLKDNAAFLAFMTLFSNVVLKLGTFVVFPLAFFSMTSGTASLSRRKGHGSFMLLSTIFWAGFTSAVLAFVAAILFRVFPAAFPATSTMPESAEQAAALFSSLSDSTLSSLHAANPLSVNAFLNFIKSSDCLIPIILVALIFGYAIRPTSEIVRPAYIVLNSLSEAMFRLAKLISRFLWIGLFFIAGTWFEKLWSDGTVFASWKFMVLICIVGFGMLFVVLPLIYGICTGFRRNPYRQIGRLFSSGVAAFFSVNYLFCQSTLYTDCRVNLGIQKNVVSTALPIHSVITKGGSALVSTLCTCSLVYAINGTLPTLIQTITIGLSCTLVSFLCCFHAGYEVLFATAFALELLNVDISGAEFAILGLLPLLNGLALVFDVLLSGLGTSFTAYHLKADCHIRERDTV